MARIKRAVNAHKRKRRKYLKLAKATGASPSSTFNR